MITENEIAIAHMLIGAIHDLKRPMLMYQEEKDLVEKALRQYIEPTRHKGTWKEFDTTFGRNIYYCTACGRSIEILYEYDFCPLCGADMREGEG